MRWYLINIEILFSTDIDNSEDIITHKIIINLFLNTFLLHYIAIKRVNYFR